MAQTTATFSIELTPGDGPFEGSGRFDFAKTWSGGLEGSGAGTMLSGGDPRAGIAGYVALERFEGSLDGRVGGFRMQQFGTMNAGATVLRYEVVPGSGTGELTGLIGEITLTREDGQHRVVLDYELVIPR